METLDTLLAAHLYVAHLLIPVAIGLVVYLEFKVSK